MRVFLVTLGFAALSAPLATAFAPPSTLRRPRGVALRAQKEDVEEVTEKFGLEAGLFKSLRSGEGGAATAKDLLAKYGAAYLATSISLAAVSFGICFALVDKGVDVAALLKNVGIEVSGTSETASTLAIAYAVHKAASPIRFPPTVALTPVVARFFGKKEETEG
uniref:DUF1279 domain-containing protein n=1 Tax=Pinguiococcus pyrenoidosus TaxID=172671 RepID=A0A7R9U8Q2_9STRA|mmetsp:Transcript_19356/g.73149  ORF Transcript_19356/g.73149 Transcript_19356/m.73149 type:complete len:164 (+) Transcript_19356:67-558(+)